MRGGAIKVEMETTEEQRRAKKKEQRHVRGVVEEVNEGMGQSVKWVKLGDGGGESFRGRDERRGTDREMEALINGL